MKVKSRSAGPQRVAVPDEERQLSQEHGDWRGAPSGPEASRAYESTLTGVPGCASSATSARPLATPIAMNPIATAYVRAAEEEADTSPEGTSAGAPERASHHDATDVSARGDDDIPTSIDAVIELLAEAGVVLGDGVAPEGTGDAPGLKNRAGWRGFGGLRPITLSIK